MKLKMKILIVFIGLLLFGIAGFWWYQSKQAEPKPEIFSKNGVALEGYDAVSFFNKAEPIQGKKELSYTYKGVEWRFAEKENLSTFKATPEAYIPKYGGYCAYGT
jgi:YHS domain-containing protein